MESEWGANSGDLVKRGLAERYHCSRDLKAEQEPAGEGSLLNWKGFGCSLHQGSKEAALWTVSAELLAHNTMVPSGRAPRDRRQAEGPQGTYPLASSSGVASTGRRITKPGAG